MRRLLAALLIGLIAGTAHAGTWWEETFEDPNMPNWDVSWFPSNGLGPIPVYPPMGVVTDQKFNGTHAIKLNFPQPDGGGGPFIDRTYPDTTDLWARVYTRLTNFGYGNSGFPIKMIQFFWDSTHYPNFWWVLGPPAYNFPNFTAWIGTQLDGSPFLANICPHGPYDGCNYGGNVGGLSMAMDNWYCWEIHVKMNDPGVANGVIEEWGTNMTTGGPRTKVIEYFDRTLRGPNVVNPAGCTGQCNTSTAKFTTARIYRQHGTGDLWHDDLAVGNTPIPCAGAPAKVSQPTGVSVTVP